MGFWSLSCKGGTLVWPYYGVLVVLSHLRENTGMWFWSSLSCSGGDTEVCGSGVLCHIQGVH